MAVGPWKELSELTREDGYVEGRNQQGQAIRLTRTPGGGVAMIAFDESNQCGAWPVTWHTLWRSNPLAKNKYHGCHEMQANMQKEFTTWEQ